ncbi:hypothetical protein J7E50_24660 [Pedobacter sp. ISL-68]|uniref:hypothetical protein n=1 Tax=unclassified Pedobacter TaxID=2628915 RepID=UPI001BE55DC4|nr:MULTISPECIES: hypothetical protein [unclassified Pedobacter]MBT2564879.1 hypothetical protein [Pedobacter sp. ISL-64]MBT2593436.1 hypothetical protein [Pedobacter sp. ISL-68]
MEQTIDIQISTKKLYKDRAIWVGTFLGGPLAAGYLIAENFKTFNEFDKAKKTWIYAIIATIVVFGGVFLIPENVKIPNQIIPLIYTAIAYYLVKHFQGQKITSHINSGRQLHSWWRTIGVGVIGLTITVIPIFGFALLIDSGTNVGTDTKTYGVMKHEIAFDKNNISETEVNKIADGLTKTVFFDEAVTKYVYAKKLNDSYEISISCDKSITSNEEALQPFVQLRTELQTLFPDNKIAFNLVVDSLDNIVKRLE